MNEAAKELAFVPACQQFFGRKPDQTLQQFMLECKELTQEDRVEIAEGLRLSGLHVIPQK